MKKSSKENDVDLIVHELEQMRIKSPDKKSFSNGWFGFDQLIDLLVVKSHFPNDVSDIDRRLICRRSAFKQAAKGEIKSNGLRGEIARGIEAFKKEKPKTFVLATSFGIRNWKSVKKFKDRGVEIRISDNLPDQFIRDHAPQDILQRINQKPFYSRFASVTVKVSARSEWEAYRRATESTSFLRGMWNFSLNRNVINGFTSDETKPINVILPGPLTTLHYPDGTPATTIYWYDPFFDEKIDPFDASSDKWHRVLKEERQIRARLKVNLTFTDNIVQCFSRYCDANDNRDHQNTFLRLWSLLECLTGNPKNYDDVIDRISFLYADPVQLDRMLLKSFRETRNQMVHHGVSNSEWRSMSIGLHRYVCEALLFSIRAANRFENFDELTSFLSLPRNPQILDKEIELRKFARRFKGSRTDQKNKST